MRLLTAASLLALLLACAGGGKTEDSDDDGVPDVEEEFEGDDAGECDDAADNDRDGDFDCEDSDCRDAPGCEEEEEEENVEYEGSVVGETSDGEGGLPCEGTFWLEVEPDGTAFGEATCAFGPGFAMEGPIDGEVDGTDFVGEWETKGFGGVELEGDATESRFDAAFELEVEGGRFFGTFEGRS